MSLDRSALQAAVARHGRVARIVVAAVAGSAPREVGAAMLVWAEGQSGTIGGGALEWQALAMARQALGDGRDRLERLALGPALGQCCGGAVTLVTECWDAGRVQGIPDGVMARALPGMEGPAPLAVQRILARARDRGLLPGPGIVQGWMVEPVAAARRDLWVWGAGHVGRAIVGVLAPLPDLALTWIDTAADRFPGQVPEGVAVRVAGDPVALLPGAPVTAAHLIVTYSHALDLALCDGLLRHGFRTAGLIGSATKWARFRGRLAALGHAPAEISRIACPIGDPGLGKHPQAIAVGVAMQLLSGQSAIQSARDRAG